MVVDNNYLVTIPVKIFDDGEIVFREFSFLEVLELKSEIGKDASNSAAQLKVFQVLRRLLPNAVVHHNLVRADGSPLQNDEVVEFIYSSSELAAKVTAEVLEKNFFHQGKKSEGK